MPLHYEARPRIVTAVKWDGTNADELVDFLGGPDLAEAKEQTVAGADRSVVIALVVRTLKGNHRMQKGDYLVKENGKPPRRVEEYEFDEAFQPIIRARTGFPPRRGDKVG